MHSAAVMLTHVNCQVSHLRDALVVDTLATRHPKTRIKVHHTDEPQQG